MSQHLLTEFINRTYTFKAFKDARIVNRKIKKYQGSNRDNNELPQVVAKGASVINTVQTAVNNEQEEEKKDAGEVGKKIDITV